MEDILKWKRKQEGEEGLDMWESVDSAPPIPLGSTMSILFSASDSAFTKGQIYKNSFRATQGEGGDEEMVFLAFRSLESALLHRSSQSLSSILLPSFERVQFVFCNSCRFTNFQMVEDKREESRRKVFRVFKYIFSKQKE